MNELNFLDMLNVLSFYIGILNLQENLTQGDKQDLMSKFDQQTQDLLDKIQASLDSQNEQLKQIIREVIDEVK